jgi:hypothetical protein
MAHLVDAILNYYLLLRTSEPLKNVRWANLAVLPDFDEGDRALLLRI